jgi:predicted O-methyltransferase YrrM
MSAPATTQLSDAAMEQLAYERGFHDGEIPRGLTLDPLRALRDSLRPGMRTVETGCGGSTVVFAAAGARHTVITPSGAEAERVRGWCTEHGVSHENVDFVIASSDQALVTWSEELDLVLIDGAHRVPFPYIDWHYTTPWLKPGGRVFLDDVAVPAVHSLFDFLRGEDEWRLVGIPGDKTAVFELLSKPDPNPDLDWEAQRYNLRWTYRHVPLARRVPYWRKQLALGTRLRALRDR